MRRLRKSPEIRGILAAPPPSPANMIWPVFIIPGKNKKIPINSMPGQFRWTTDTVLPQLEKIAKIGIGGIMLFGVPEDSGKSDDGNLALGSGNPVLKAISLIRKEIPSIAIFADLCLCGYTRNGQCGIAGADGSPDNARSLEILSKTGLAYAEAGAHGVAPSAMMDGQVCEIRKSLDSNGFSDTLIMSYSAKFASSFYGPFRDAASSAPHGADRSSHQLACGALDQAVMESILDESEGADILMVKPALPYLDVIAKTKEATRLPLAAFNVSGEYSMIHAAAERGWGNLLDMARESLISIKRAGADIIISYWSDRFNDIFQK